MLSLPSAPMQDTVRFAAPLKVCDGTVSSVYCLTSARQSVYGEKGYLELDMAAQTKYAFGCQRCVNADRRGLD